MTTTKDTAIKQTNWTSPSNAPKQIQDWAGHQMVQLAAANEALEKWVRFDGEIKVVRI
jgi:hypothetical protein